MASVVTICNMALSHLGSEALVTAISPPDGSVEAGWCATYYDQARTELLEASAWGFALTRATLGELTNESDLWEFCYAVPSDAIRCVRIISAGADDLTGVNFDREGDVLYTMEEDAVLVYVRDVTDTTKFPPSFVSALSFVLAGYLAGPIIKGTEGMKIGDAMRERARVLVAASAALTANGTQDSHETSPSIVAVRA